MIKKEISENEQPLFRSRLLDTAKGYSWKELFCDVMAGLTVAVIALPLSITIAIASGVSPEKGIYTAIIAGFLTALFGGSRVNISGPSTAFAAITAGIVAASGTEGLVIATVFAGIILILTGVFKWGKLIHHIPQAVTTGLALAIALTIVIGQIKDFFGLTFAPGAPPITTVEKIGAILQNAATVDLQSLLVGGVCLLLLIILPRIGKKIPAAPITVIIGVLMVVGLDLLASAELIDGFQVTVNTVGDLYIIEGELPSFALPSFRWSSLPSLLPAAVVIAVIAGTESLFSCTVSDNMTGDKHNPNTELIALGIGNIFSGFFGGIPACGSAARTAANAKNGGKTPVAGIVHAIILLIVLGVLMPYAGYIPLPAVSAILFVAAYKLCGWRQLIKICKTAPKCDLLILAVTFLCALLFDLTIALLAGVAIAKTIRIGRKQLQKKH